MSLALRADLSTGEAIVSVNGTDRFKLDVNGNLVLLASAAKVVGGVPLLPAGAFQLFQLAAAPVGWIAGDGGTIGPAGSGATRADNDTLDLFTAWWSAYTNAQLPIFTSTGAASTRGASAAADWSAGKRLTVFDVRDRVARASGAIQANGTKLEATVVYDNFGNTTVVTPGSGTGTLNSDGATSIPAAYYSSGPATLNGATNLQAQKVRVASLGMLGCYKL